MKIRNCDDLIKHINKGSKVKYVFFWGHQKPVEGISKSCFSQWYESSFIVNEITYLTAEHYMMAEKARLFSDDATASKIVEATNPDAAKKFGREVIGFEEDLWIKNRFNIVMKGNLAKFKQNAEIRGFLLNTKNRVLVEASPVDKIWGIGLSADNSSIEDPSTWQGLNLLGFALMEVRDQLKEYITINNSIHRTFTRECSSP